MAGVSYLFTHIHAWHQISVKPEITSDFALQEVPSGSYGLVHFLGEGCGCSKIIANHLVKRGRISGVTEEVWLVGNSQELAPIFKDSDFVVKIFKVEPKENPPINAVPAFGVYDHKKTFHYMGAYVEGPVRPNSDFQDVSIYRSLKAERSVASLSVTGCVVAEKYKKLLDPFGIKYGAMK